MTRRIPPWIPVLLACVLVAPMLAVAAFSLSPTSALDVYARKDISLRWWSELFQDRSWLYALSISLAVATLSALLALLLALPAVLYWRLTGSRLAGHVITASALSFCIPPVVLAVGLYQVSVHLGMFDTIAGLACAHLAWTLPSTLLVLRGGFTSTPLSVFSAARSLGAPPVVSALTWLMATQRRTLAAAVATACLLSVSEVTITVYVTDVRVVPLSKRAIAGMGHNIDPTGFAFMSTWLLILGIGVFMLSGVRQTGGQDG